MKTLFWYNKVIGGLMKKGKILYGIMCGAGGILIGVFANRLDTIYGGVLFTFGVFLLVFSIFKLNK